MANVDGVNMARSALQKDVCKAPRARADIKANLAGRVNAEGLERAFKF